MWNHHNLPTFGAVLVCFGLFLLLQPLWLFATHSLDVVHALCLAWARVDRDLLEATNRWLGWMKTCWNCWPCSRCLWQHLGIQGKFIFIYTDWFIGQLCNIGHICWFAFFLNIQFDCFLIMSLGPCNHVAWLNLIAYSDKKELLETR